MMATSPVDLITISREYGAGASDLAAMLSARLEWPVLDRDLVRQIAEQLQLDPRIVEGLDEYPPTFMARIAAGLLITPPETLVAVDASNVMSPDAVAEAARKAIEKAAQSPPLIVVGHGAQCIFRGRPRALHIRLLAPLDSRVSRVCAREPADPPEAAPRARRVDHARAEYIRRYYQSDWRDGLLYDYQINTGRVSIEEAAEMIVRVVQARNSS
jgi:cytidylate kinase